MTISSETRKAGPYTGNGSQTSFPFTFKVFTTADVQVIRTDLAGNETTLVLGTDYTVTLNSNQDSNPGGTVTTTSAPASGFLITLTSQVSATQSTDLTNQGGFYPNVINTALDKMTILVQQLKEQVSRAVKVNISSSITPEQLVAELESGATTATAAAAAASASQAAAASSETNAAASASAAQNYVGNIIQNPILGDDVFSGNGATTAFTLSRNMGTGNETALLVTISGVTQAPTAAYTVSGTTLTFTSAPPSGTNNIRVRYIGAMAVNAALASTAATNAAASATAASTSASNASTSASTANIALANTQSAIASAVLPLISTSTTSLAIGTGSKSFTTQTGKAWVPGHSIAIVSAANATNSMTGTVTSYNSGTGALVVNVTTTGGSGTYADWQMSQATSGGIQTGQYIFRIRTSGTSYTPASNVARFWVFVHGASSAAWSSAQGAVGGTGYAEKYYSTPTGSYSYSIGAGGTGSTASTTTFDTISVTGAAFSSTATGAAGGTATGGDFNANGGTGGSSGGSSGYAGPGGPGTRAGAGGNGGNSVGATGGGAGGTGGNNATGGTGGAAASAVSGSAITLPWSPQETFGAGGSNSTNNSGNAAIASPSWDVFGALIPTRVAAEIGRAHV